MAQTWDELRYGDRGASVARFSRNAHGKPPTVATGETLRQWLLRRGHSEADIRTILMTSGRQHTPPMSCDVPWIVGTETDGDL